MLIQSCNIYLLPTCYVKGIVITSTTSSGKLYKKVWFDGLVVNSFYKLDVIKGSEIIWDT
jgi:hypothetical protein